jgi:hypothetical protein
MSNINAEELQRRISQLADTELWRLVNVEAAQYRDEALVIAKAEILRRGATFQPLIEREEATAKEDEPEFYSEEEQIRINEEAWNKTGKPALTIGISLACWGTYFYFWVTAEPDKTWQAPFIAFGVCAGLDVLSSTVAKERTKTKWRQTLKSAVTIGLLSVGVAIVAHWVLFLLGALLHRLIKGEP